MNIKIIQAKSRQELNQCFQIRSQVFQNEQNVDQALEFDGLDETAIHFIAYEQERPVGTVRLRKIKKNEKTEPGEIITAQVIKLERMAVIKEMRGQGIAQTILEHCISFSRQAGFLEIIMHAQFYLQAFYEKAGFQTLGRPFMEAGIKHIKMQMKLNP